MTQVVPSEVGARAEMAIASALQRAGMEVFVPLFVPQSRVDLIAVSEERLLRVQCKSARLRGGSVFFPTCSNTGNLPRSYGDEVDAIAAYSPELEAVYLVPIHEAPERGCTLRLTAPQNHQRSRIRWAADYLVGPP